jgi:putative membrane protein
MVDYDPHEWRSHLLDIRGSMIREIFGRVTTCMLWAVAVVCAHEFLLHHHQMSLAIPEQGHGLTGVALGLLLVFRTNASYDRFWEGRKQWGSIVNECRNLARQASIYFAQAPEVAHRVVFWTAAFAYASMHRLRGTSGLGPPADELPSAEVAAVGAESHVPLAVARRLTATIAEGRRLGLVSDIIHGAFEQNVQLLIDYIGACERIHNTRIPFAYMVHLRRALIVYCFTLPFALLDRFGWVTIPGVLLIVYVLYGIEEIGVEIEDPFGHDENDLPLEDFCKMIETNLRGVLAKAPSASPDPAAAASAAS